MSGHGDIDDEVRRAVAQMARDDTDVTETLDERSYTLLGMAYTLAQGHGWDVDGFRQALCSIREFLAETADDHMRTLCFLQDQVAQARKEGDHGALSVLLGHLTDLAGENRSTGARQRPAAGQAWLAPFMMLQADKAVQAHDTAALAVLLGHLREIAETEGAGGCWLETLLDLAAGESGFVAAYGAQGRFRDERWSLCRLRGDAREVVGGYAYEVVSLYEHFASEVRVSVMRALLADERALGVAELAEHGGCNDPADCLPHLNALMDAGIVEEEAGQYQLARHARPVVTLALSIAGDWAHGSRAEEGT